MTVFNKIKSRWCVVVLLLIAILITGCKKELPEDIASTLGSVSVQVSVRNVIADPDCEITSLRMLAFNANNKSLVLNTLFNPDEVYDNVNKNYLLSGELKNTSATKLVVIANERTDWRLTNGITYDGMQALKALYYKEDLSDVKSPFLMFVGVEEDIPTPAGTKIEKSVSLERNVVKVTLNLKQKLLQPNSSNTALTFKKLHIENIPRHGFLTPQQVYPSTEGYTATAAHSFAPTDFELDENYSILKESLVFYIPEHLLTDKTNYSRILISASRNSGGEDVTYEIPLGSGVDKLYHASPVAFADLSATDLSCVRNTHFNIDATISLASVDVALSVKEWTEQKVEGEINAPYLNISSLEQQMRLLDSYQENGNWFFPSDPEEVIFLIWTNLPKEELKLDTDMKRVGRGEYIPITGMFAYTWTVTQTADGFLPGAFTTTGTLRLKPAYGGVTLPDTYEMKVTARNLSRNFKVIVPSNPR